MLPSRKRHINSTMKQKLSNITQKIKDLPLLIKIGFIAAIVLLISLISIFVLLGAKKDSPKTETKLENENLLYSSLVFRPQELPLEKNKIQSTPIVLDLGENSAKKITFTVKFEPDSVSLIDLIQKLDPTSPLSNSFATEDVTISVPDGTATISLSLRDGALEQMGKGEIAQFSFRINPQFTGKLGFTIQDVTIGSDKTDGKVLIPQTNTLIITQ